MEEQYSVETEFFWSALLGVSVCVALQYSGYLALMGFWCCTCNSILQAQPWPITLSSKAQTCPWRYGQIISKSNINPFLLKCPVKCNYYLNIQDVKTDVWKFCSLVLVEESICGIPEEGRRAQELVITLCVASLCWPGSQGLVSTIGAFRFTLLYGRGKNHFLYSFYYLVSLHRKIFKRTGVFFFKCYLVILKPVGVSVSPRWAESFCSKWSFASFFQPILKVLYIVLIGVVRELGFPKN